MIDKTLPDATKNMELPNILRPEASLGLPLFARLVGYYKPLMSHHYPLYQLSRSLLVIGLLLCTHTIARAEEQFTKEQLRSLLYQLEDRIRRDISYTKDELHTPGKFKPEFVKFYIDKVDIAHQKPIDRIRDYAIHFYHDKSFTGKKLIIFWTEGIAIDDWGSREWLYVTSIGEDKRLTVEVAKQLYQPTYLFDIDENGEFIKNSHGFFRTRYKLSDYWPKPNSGCGFNAYILGALRTFTLGASASSVYMYIIGYDRYEKEFFIDEDLGGVVFKPDPSACEKNTQYYKDLRN